MRELLTASPMFAAYRCQPMSVAEIDAHPDSGRIWATIKSMQADAAEDTDEAVNAARIEEEDTCDDLRAGDIRRLCRGVSLCLKTHGDGELRAALGDLMREWGQA